MPGACVPEDIMGMFPSKHLVDSVDLALKSKRFSIDWYEDESPGYYIRPATKGKEGVVKDPSWRGRCTFLTKTGCELSFEQRPLICRSLEPKLHGVITHCLSSIKENEKLYASKLWDKTGINLGRI